ncbi:hypothetical protein PDE_06019 [Penicillium oxalicum 114-2]|uniref:Uncharacterized protein n=1 Tax=Penicillium oxalicum (strain 114-2 / CGMCC 5302) TaxID=933388 RepID=S7ZKA4_PENO1|nr:hypothetical protein PDE_06019 [Penicillium oxalicum 114-2]
MAIRTFLRNLLAKLSHLKQRSFSHSAACRRQSSGGLETRLRDAANRDGLYAQDRWIQEHKAEMQAGGVIEQEGKLIASRLRSFQDLFDEPGPSNPWFMGDIIECEAELERVNQNLTAHRARVIELEAYRPPGKMARQYFDLHGQCLKSE